MLRRARADGEPQWINVDFQLSQATGTAEREMAPKLVDEARERGFRVRTLGADNSYDTKNCVADLRQRQVTPHVAQNTTGRRSAIDGRTTRHIGYAISQCVRKRVEEIFAWMKVVGGFRRTRYPRSRANPTGCVHGSDGVQSCAASPVGSTMAA